MNVCTRLGSRHLPWPEIAAVRFLVGALLAAGLAADGRPGAPRDGPRRHLAPEHLRHPRRGRQLLRPRLQPYRRRRRRHARCHHPIFVALLSRPLLGERVGRHVAVAVTLAFAGVLAIVRPSFAIAWPVALVATAGAVFYALAMLWLRRIGPGESHEAIVLHFSLVGLATHGDAGAAGLALAGLARRPGAARRRPRGRRCPARHDARLRAPARGAGDRHLQPRRRLHLPARRPAVRRPAHPLAARRRRAGHRRDRPAHRRAAAERSIFHPWA